MCRSMKPSKHSNTHQVPSLDLNLSAEILFMTRGSMEVNIKPQLSFHIFLYEISKKMPNFYLHKSNHKIIKNDLNLLLTPVPPTI